MSSCLLGAMIGALLAGTFSDRFGPKTVLLANNVSYIIGPLGMAFAMSNLQLIAARLFTGIGVGVSSALVNVYINEIVPAERRGEYGGVASLFCTLGILISLLVSSVFGQYWRLALGLAAVPATLQLVFGNCFLPESPAWRRRNSLKDVPFLQKTKEGPWSALREALRSETQGKEVRKAIFVGVGLQVLQQITGINVTVYYGPKIFATSFSAEMSNILSAAVTLASMLAGLALSKSIDRIGRLPMSYIGVVGMGISLALLAFIYGQPQSGLTGWASCASVLVYRICFGFSLGPLPYIVTAEIFPANCRAAGASLCWSFNWISNFVTSLTFLPLVEATSEAGAFSVYSCICGLALLFLYFGVPETKDANADVVAVARHNSFSTPSASPISPVDLD